MLKTDPKFRCSKQLAIPAVGHRAAVQLICRNVSKTSSSLAMILAISLVALFDGRLNIPPSYFTARNINPDNG
jgi:hypothetical protein